MDYIKCAMLQCEYLGFQARKLQSQGMKQNMSQEGNHTSQHHGVTIHARVTRLAIGLEHHLKWEHQESICKRGKLHIGEGCSVLDPIKILG